MPPRRYTLLLGPRRAVSLTLPVLASLSFKLSSISLLPACFVHAVFNSQHSWALPFRFCLGCSLRCHGNMGPRLLRLPLPFSGSSMSRPCLGFVPSLGCHVHTDKKEGLVIKRCSCSQPMAETAKRPSKLLPATRP